MKDVYIQILIVLVKNVLRSLKAQAFILWVFQGRKILKKSKSIFVKLNLDPKIYKIQQRVFELSKLFIHSVDKVKMETKKENEKASRVTLDPLLMKQDQRQESVLGWY